MSSDNWSTTANKGSDLPHGSRKESHMYSSGFTKDEATIASIQRYQTDAEDISVASHRHGYMTQEEAISRGQQQMARKIQDLDRRSGT
ncbi:hypothetical protein BP6252_02412 [Coleophoma cylindrospora]|uniref:Uncharacterized protein n=1 Tax=Coleophoma cylindrospora TaxID=1849047 RepID=A0A3D8SES2_9HELO|nr:hypothetical protein BP6252_02412 [Coleophoma cylindrospora]